ncbi:MAG: hypothetical protein MUC36_15850 [Planctomycetes bacterium]|nr:hypothetical protein [Planctomycetota bacterium]
MLRLPMTSPRPMLVPFVLCCAVACGGGKVEFSAPKEVTKEQRPTVFDASAKQRLDLPEMRGTAGGQGPQGAPGAQGGDKQWVAVVPQGWEALAANPGKFRDAQWRITGQADCDIYFTAGVGGGVKGNLARWYTQQFGKAEAPAAESLEIIELAGRTGRLADLSGTFAGKSGWAALIAFAWQGDQVTSLKFTGPEAVVKANRDKFLAVARSLKLATASPNPAAPPIQPGQAMPDNHPPIGGSGPTGQGAGGQSGQGNPPPPTPAAAPFHATVPAGWAAKPGTSRVLHHTFGADGEVYLSQLGGTLKQNLDIWRGEMSLAPLTDAEFAALPKAAFLGDDSVLLDVAGNFQSMSGKKIDGARMLVAARLDGQTITFAKLVAGAADTTAQLDAFRAFCGSVRRAQ